MMLRQKFVAVKCSQGVDQGDETYILIDPAVLTPGNGSSRPPTDLGQSAIDAFTCQHTCSSICNALRAAGM